MKAIEVEVQREFTDRRNVDWTEIAISNRDGFQMLDVSPGQIFDLPRASAPAVNIDEALAILLTQEKYAHLEDRLVHDLLTDLLTQYPGEMAEAGVRALKDQRWKGGV